MKINDALRTTRYQSGKSQEYMALELGVTRRTIMNWENSSSLRAVLQIITAHLQTPMKDQIVHGQLTGMSFLSWMAANASCRSVVYDLSSQISSTSPNTLVIKNSPITIRKMHFTSKNI